MASPTGGLEMLRNWLLFDKWQTVNNIYERVFDLLKEKPNSFPLSLSKENRISIVARSRVIAMRPIMVTKKKKKWNIEIFPKTHKSSRYTEFI